MVDGKPVANRVEPNKRPRSSMTPLVVLDREGKHFVLGIGSPGGSRIIAYVMRAALGVLDHRLDPQQAVSLPHVVNRNGVTELEKSEQESAWAQSTADGLKKLGHEVEIHDLNSGLHAILRQPAGGYVGGADPRREGLVLGE
jgi:gamma-glutamyltranspeptidase/glutathione hydrolase